MSNPRFAVGDHVMARALTNSFPTSRPEVRGLVVTTVTLVHKPRPYFRVMAVAPDGFGYVEGAERFFEPETT